MKHTSLIVLLSILLVSCGPTIYKAKDFESSREKMKTMAVLPFSVVIDAKRLPKGISIETLKESQTKTGYEVQSNAYTWLLKSKKVQMQFQDIDRTNAIIKKAGIAYDDIALTDKAELCKLLGVDGLISGKVMTSKPMSEGAAVAVGLLAGAWGPTNKAHATLTIHNSDASLLWKYEYDASGSVGSNSEALSRNLMNNASKHFPFKK